MAQGLRFFIIHVWVGSIFFLFYSAVHADEHPMHIYLDADLTSSITSSRSIEQGIITALSETGYRISSRKVKLIKLDHRGNSRRSLENLKQILNDPSALAVFGGLHSPPLLANRDFINKNGLLHLIPWAAAGPITRYESGENWIFRLSIDDTKAGRMIVHHNIGIRGNKKPALLLEETGWGRSNAVTIHQALSELGLSSSGVFWFKWGTQKNTARIILRKIIQSGADSIIMVANAPEGKVFAKEMAAFPEKERLPFCSHWGITGGDFVQVVTPEIRAKIDLSFLQTRFSFLTHPLPPLGQHVLETAKRLFPTEIFSPGDIKAPTGFIHAYDLTRIFIAAARPIKWSGNIRQDRQAIKQSLENLPEPVPGLIKIYKRPFSPFHADNPDAHEALSAAELVMGSYDDKGCIRLMDQDH